MKKLFILFALCALMAMFAASAQAELVYQTDVHKGSFTEKSYVFSETFTISEEQTVWIFTDSYYTTQVDVGFVLWDDTTGKYMNAAEDNNRADLFVYHADKSTDGGKSKIGHLDAVLERTLGPGTYRVTLIPTIDGQSAYDVPTESIEEFYADRETFIGDYSGDFRLKIVYAPSAVPVPASALLLAPGIAAITALRRKFK